MDRSRLINTASQIAYARPHDTRSEPAPGCLLSPLSANLGHAVLLCLQNQDEVASKRTLFHRQNERHIPESLKATIPYFLGAVPEDQAALQQQLTQARRALRRAENDLKAAQEANQGIEARLESLLGEARVHGLLTDTSVDTSDRAAVIELLQQAASFRQTPHDADEEQRSQELLLNDLETQAAGYTGAVARGMSRLSALNLVSDGFPGEPTCPLCGNELTEPDPPSPTCTPRSQTSGGSSTMSGPSSRAVNKPCARSSRLLRACSNNCAASKVP